jgi:hypothetical protein
VGKSTQPQGGFPEYEVIMVTQAGPTTILRRDGSTPSVLVGFSNYASSNQTVTATLSDVNGNASALPQIGQLGATQIVTLQAPGQRLLNGLVVTPSGAPIAPGIAVLVR